MANYPYEADFLKPMPANPVDVVCEILIDSGTSTHELIIAIAKAVAVYTNYTGIVQCNDLEGKDSKLGEQEWDFQVKHHAMKTRKIFSQLVYIFYILVVHRNGNANVFNFGRNVRTKTLGY